ncbi:MAG: biotin transporter BioY [Thermoleophilia bacterium]
MFAALVAVLGLTPAVNVPGISVPVTAQTLGVMVAGLLLVPVEAFLSLALFVALVAAGLPLSGGRGRPGRVQRVAQQRVRAGLLVAAAVTAVVATLALMAGACRSRVVLPAALFTAAVLGGVVVEYAIGIPVGAAVADIPLHTFLHGSMTFLPGDLAKAGRHPGGGDRARPPRSCGRCGRCAASHDRRLGHAGRRWPRGAGGTRRRRRR